MKKIIDYFKIKYIESVDYRKIITAVVVIVFALLSLIFSRKIELLLNLDYDFSSIETSDAQVHFIDVGQGDCIAINFENNKKVLIDCGAPSSENKLIKYLDEIFFHNSDKKFDYAILTHTDNDHIGNFSLLLDIYNFEYVYLPINIVDHQEYGALYNKILENNCKVIFNYENIKINISENSSMKWLSPTTNFNDNENDFSPIILANVYNKTFLLTGDASSQVENIVLINHNIENVDVLKASHHGSSTSTSYNFLSTVKPKNIVFSVGDNNYDHPSSEVIENIINYENEYCVKCNLYSTLNQGNIIFKINEEELTNESILNINRYFFIDWWLVVILFIIFYCMYFILSRKYAINKVYQKSIMRNGKRK